MLIQFWRYIHLKSIEFDKCMNIPTPRWAALWLGKISAVMGMVVALVIFTRTWLLSPLLTMAFRKVGTTRQHSSFSDTIQIWR